LSELNNETDAAIFDLRLKDSEILTLTKGPVQDSETYWESTFGLKKVRSDNMNLWLPKHYKDADVYDYQQENLYQEPRIFTSVETICSVVNARIPMPSVSPGQDSPISIKLSQDVGRAMYGHSQKYQTQDIFRVATRNLLLKRVAYIKLRFDKSIGKIGDITPELVMPEDMIVDQDAVWGEVPRFMAQKIKNKSYEELIAYFPEAEQKILEMSGTKRRDGGGDLVGYKTQLAKKAFIYEIWFKYFEDGQWKGGVTWIDENFGFVLGKMRNPNWNYDEDDTIIGNVLDQPEPPYIAFNYLNDGSSFIDLTSMVEQATTMQKILDRRGFQIMDNADQAGSGMIFNTMMITKEDIAKLVGAPDEKIGVKGDVRQAVTRVAPPPLPNYVIEDKMDARQQIDDIFGTHDISRGKESGNKTLGQDKIQVNQDYTRMDDISRAVLRASIKYYRYLAQMFKVYYTEEHWFKVTGEDGQFDFIMMKNDLIEDGIDITVDEGSNMPMNKGAQQEFATSLASLGMIDPLTLYEVGSGMPLPSPKKMLERLLSYQTDPAAFAGIANQDEIDRLALIDIQILNAGELPKPRDEVKPEYLAFFSKYMTGGDYATAVKRKPEIEQLYIAFLTLAQQTAQATLQKLQSQMPTPQEMQVQNDQSVKDAEQTQAIQGSPPASPSGSPQPAPTQSLTPPSSKTITSPTQAV